MYAMRIVINTIHEDGWPNFQQIRSVPVQEVAVLQKEYASPTVVVHVFPSFIALRGGKGYTVPRLSWLALGFMGSTAVGHSIVEILAVTKGNRFVHPIIPSNY